MTTMKATKARIIPPVDPASKALFYKVQRSKQLTKLPLQNP